MLHTEVRVKGVIEKKWADWFEGLTIITLSADETVLVGELPDQAALYGLLARLRDLRFDLRFPHFQCLLRLPVAVQLRFQRIIANQFFNRHCPSNSCSRISHFA